MNWNAYLHSLHIIHEVPRTIVDVYTVVVYVWNYQNMQGCWVQKTISIYIASFISFQSISIFNFGNCIVQKHYQRSSWHLWLICDAPNRLENLLQEKLSNTSHTLPDADSASSRKRNELSWSHIYGYSQGLILDTYSYVLVRNRVFWGFGQIIQSNSANNISTLKPTTDSMGAEGWGHSNSQLIQQSAELWSGHQSTPMKAGLRTMVSMQNF